MRVKLLIAGCTCLPFLLVYAARLPAADVERPDFQRDIRPLLAANCFSCHGPDEESRQAELRLDVREDAVAARDGGAAIVPGDAQASQIIERITAEDPALRMPPADSGHELGSSQVQQLRRWIEQGAEYAEHWAFVPATRPTLPAVRNRDWARTPIDYFLLAQLEQRGLQPAPEADRATLIRRLSLDLTGLPPSVEEVDAFLQDQSPRAYERLVDRLLESSGYGEHWARMWLDLARYADTKGYEKDQPRDIWQYRDWVIRALNADMPYDRFTIEQLAGDLLPQATDEQLVATAFHRNTMTNDEGGTDNEEFRVAAVKDRVDTTLQVWMGLTMGCAKCHSHKYDPIAMREYYQFFAVFNQTEDADRPNDAPRLPTPSDAQRAERAELQRQLAELRVPEDAAPELRASRWAWEQPLRDALSELNARIPEIPIMRELPEEKQRESHVHVRGNFLEKGERVEPGVPAAFGDWPRNAARNRLGVARWLVADTNPLTARVAVNRFWARLFGRGIVETEEDFGTQGAAPSHPQLLDWLAVEFQTTMQWSMKQLVRQIVLSSVYRQSSLIDADKVAKDPENRWLSRAPRFRLPAETIRDQALAASGLLSEKMYGPSVMPPQPPGIWKTTYSSLNWETSPGENRYRRGLYTFLRRTSPYPSMITFDAGSREVCLLRRVRTNTPLQALITMNDPVYVEAAGALAARMLKFEVAKAGRRATHGFRRVLARHPSAAEVDRLVQMYQDARETFRQQPEAAAALLRAANQPLPDEQPETMEHAAWTVVANVLLNLDEAMMRN